MRYDSVKKKELFQSYPQSYKTYIYIFMIRLAISIIIQ